MRYIIYAYYIVRIVDLLGKKIEDKFLYDMNQTMNISAVSLIYLLTKHLVFKVDFKNFMILNLDLTRPCEHLHSSIYSCSK